MMCLCCFEKMNLLVSSVSRSDLLFSKIVKLGAPSLQQCAITSFFVSVFFYFPPSYSFHQLLKCNRHEGDRSWLLPVVRYLFRPRAEKLRLLEERKGANVNKRK